MLERVVQHPPCGSQYSDLPLNDLEELNKTINLAERVPKRLGTRGLGGKRGKR